MFTSGTSRGRYLFPAGAASEDALPGKKDLFSWKMLALMLLSFLYFLSWVFVPLSSVPASVVEHDSVDSHRLMSPGK